MARKYVLTGGPGSGKSSIILALEYRGEAVMREVAGDFINLQQAMGIPEPWKDPKFQDRIRNWQVTREMDADKIAKNGRVFLDRGVLDGLAYCQMDGTSTAMRCADRIIKQTKPYGLIFVVENHGCCETTGTIRESRAEAMELETLQERNYWEAGYEPVRVPAGPLEERVGIILEHVRQHEEAHALNIT